jgi:hypothetical protein
MMLCDDRFDPTNIDAHTNLKMKHEIAHSWISLDSDSSVDIMVACHTPTMV